MAPEIQSTNFTKQVKQTSFFLKARLSKEYPKDML